MTLYSISRFSLCLAAVPLSAGLARSTPECDHGIEQLSQRIPDVTDDYIKVLLENDLRQARQQAGEGDSAECAEILDHAEKLMRPVP